VAMPPYPSSEARRARIGILVIFWLNGAGIGSLLPRYPEIKTALELSDTAWGIAIAVGPIGGLAAGLLTATLIRRFSSAWVCVVSQALGVMCLNISGNATTGVVFALGLFTMAAFDALTDISMNAHGLRVQRLYGRSILNSLHGWWSIGAVSGGFLGSIAAQAHLPVWIQTAITSVVFAGIALAARPLLLAGPDQAGVPEPREVAPRPRGIPGAVLVRLAALGMLGAAAGVIEDSASSWGAVYLDRAFAVVPFVSGMAFVALQASQMIGRFTGDALVHRFGPVPSLVQGMAAAGLGILLAVILPTPATTIVGFAAAGWGVATVIPSAMRAADELPGLKHGSGLTVVTWLMRIGFFAGPPIIGALGDAVGLRWALLVVPAAAALAIILSPALKPLSPAPTK
ncbi:MAG: MFS transporter, partial [Arachnia sp.]